MGSKFDNIAFISYKREDEEWAKWLQKKLEHYKLPTEIRRKFPNLEFSERPRHVFKDTTDLSGGVLAEEIKKGLDSSKYLIVICSPRAARSKWVCKEVQNFIDTRREKYIIPFIIEGEPNASNIDDECFPEALKSLTAERELLGINVNEYGREAAAVKVAARMFELSFDSLWQRFKREEKKKRRNLIATFIMAIIILLSIIAYGIWANRRITEERDKANIANNQLFSANKRITKQKGKLQEANVRILKQKSDLQVAFDKLSKTEKALSKSNVNLVKRNEELKKEKDNVIRATWKIKKNLAYAIAEKAKEKIENGELYDAMLALLEILPENKNDKTKPYIPQAEEALRFAIDKLNDSSWKKLALPIGTECCFTYHDKYILSKELQDSLENIIAIDSKSLQEKSKIRIRSNYNYLSCSHDDRYLAVGYHFNVCVYDLEAGTKINTFYLGNPLVDSILVNYNPIYLDRFLDVGEDKLSHPNILTAFFRPGKNKESVQVLDYIPDKNWILYKKMVEDEETDFNETFILLDQNSYKIIWSLTNKGFRPSDYNDIGLSFRGNYIIISSPGRFTVINILNNQSHSITTGDESDHYSNHASMTKNENAIIQRCDFTSMHIFDTKTFNCVDSLESDESLPTSHSSTLLGDKCILNFVRCIDGLEFSYLYYLTKSLWLKNKDISSQLIRININNRVSSKYNENKKFLYYDDKIGHKWDCINADFLGYTPDLQYIAIITDGFRGVRECQLLEINSGICMYKGTPDNLHDEIFEFLQYSDLLKRARNIVKDLSMSETTRSAYYLNE
ncbi:MAG: toll/interleukin-1 receptor domain-containing protein [Bacteroidales bacterium]|nr:toll/interleukin-1 receptor domain-containing protein [Bacteroidales bacterium]MDY5280396.1 toll/interleukin-1 receptor domain-containing protein [Sodaliphilus sp.]